MMRGIKLMDDKGSFYTVTAAQVDSASTGDTVLLTGTAGHVYVISNITAFKVAGTTQVFRFELDSGSSFGTTSRISQTDANDKEMGGQVYYLTSTERIIVNVTAAVGSSTIDTTVMYLDIFSPGVY